LPDTRILPGRIRDAREYLGISLSQAADALGWAIGLLARIEAGEATITGEQLRRLMRLYRRPLGWFTGESRFTPDQALLRKVENLSEHDRSAVLEFAEFLQGAGKPARPSRTEENPDG
jgi:transcriptional regulator with XRE-family HTH domain